MPHSETLGSKPCRRLPEDYRGPTRPSSVLSAKASTTSPYQPTTNPPPTKAGKRGPAAIANVQTTHQHTKNMITNDRTNNNQTIRTTEVRSKSTTKPPRPVPEGNHAAAARSRPLSSSQTTTTHPQPGQPPQGAAKPRAMETETPTPAQGPWRSGNPKACPYRSRPSARTGKQAPRSLPRQHAPTPREPPPAPRPHNGHRNSGLNILRRKEVIQPHLPVRLPCYDLVPITSLTLDDSPQTVGPSASGAAHFHDLTGGVYKARERIHRGVADPRLLATPPSRSRVAGSDPN